MIFVFFWLLFLSNVDSELVYYFCIKKKDLLFLGWHYHQPVNGYR